MWMDRILISHVLFVILPTSCEMTKIISNEHKPNTVAELVQIILGRIDGESNSQENKNLNLNNGSFSIIEANKLRKFNPMHKNYKDLDISVEFEEGTIIIPNILRTEISTVTNINHLIERQDISKANQSKLFGTQGAFPHARKQNIVGSGHIFSKIYSMIFKDVYSSTVDPQRNLQALSKEDNMPHKTNDLNDNFGANVLRKATSNHQQRVTDSLRDFSFDLRELLPRSGKNETQIMQPDYFKYSLDQAKHPYDWPSRRLLKNRGKVMKFIKEYGTKRKHLKTGNSVSKSSHFIPEVHRRKKSKFKTHLKSLRRRKFHGNHHHYRMVKKFNDRPKIYGNLPTKTKFHHGFSKHHSKSHKKVKKGFVYKKAPEFLLEHRVHNLTSYTNFGFLDVFSKTVSSLNSKFENLRKNLSYKRVSGEGTEESKTEPTGSFDHKNKNFRESEKGHAVNVAENDYYNSFINYSSRRWDEDKGSATYNHFKVWILFLEMIVLVSGIGTLLVFIYCRVRHHLRTVKIGKAADRCPKPQHRGKLMDPLLKIYKEGNDWTFKKEDGNYRKLFESSNESIAELQANSTTKADVDAESVTKSDLEFYGKNTSEADLIQLKSPLKSKVNCNKSDTFSKEFYNKRNENTNVKLQKNFSKFREKTNVTLHEHFSKIREPKYLVTSKTLVYYPNKSSSKAEHFDQESKEGETRKQEINLSSFQTQNVLNFGSKSTSTESLDLEIKSGSGNYQLFSEEGFIRENSKDFSVQKCLSPEIVKSHLSEGENDLAYSIKVKNKRMSVNDLLVPETQLSIWNRSYIVQEKKFVDNHSTAVSNLNSLQTQNVLNFGSESTSKELLDLEMKSESGNHRLFSKKSLIRENSKDVSVQKRCLSPERIKSHLSKGENDLVCSMKVKDKRMSVNDLLSPETQLPIWNRSYVIQEKKFLDTHSIAVSLESGHNHSKIIKKVPKKWKSSIPIWKGKLQVKLVSDLKDTAKI